MKTRIKKFLTMILAVVLVVTLLPTTAFAEKEDTEKQVTKNHTTPVFYDVEGDEVAIGGFDSDGVVSVKKTIEAKEDENNFDVTLEVQTKENVKDMKISADAAVVLTIDISASMAYNNAGTTENDDTKKRMYHAKEAAKKFINEYAANSAGGKRYLSIVTFGKNAEVRTNMGVGGDGWLDVSDVGKKSSAIAEIDKIGLSTNTGTYNLESGTFLEGGLKLSRNLYQKDRSGAKVVEANRFVVVLTDGNPNCWMISPTYEGSKDNTDLNGLTQHNTANDSKTSTTGGSWTSARPYAAVVASDIKAGYRNGNVETVPSKIFTIAFSTDEQGSKCTDSDGVQRSAENWLANKVATNTSMGLGANSSDALQTVFSTINARIQSWAQAWMVEDPMGEYIVYTGRATNTENQNPKFNNGKLLWDLKNGIVDYDKDTGIYTYKYTYPVTLDTLKQGFEAGKSYVANKETTLTYTIEETETRDGMVVKTGQLGDVQTVEFIVPEVKGYDGDLTFTKQDPNGDAIEGAKFKITTTKLDGTMYTQTAASDETGTVTFADIPSGHSYTLQEQPFAEGSGAAGKYLVDDRAYTFTVSYGTTSTPELATPSEDGKASMFRGSVADENLTFTNNFIEASITTNKVWLDAEGNEIKDEAILGYLNEKIEFENDDESSNAYEVNERIYVSGDSKVELHETIDQSLTNGEDFNAQFVSVTVQEGTAPAVTQADEFGNINAVDFTAEAGQTYTITFTNQLKAVGEITIRKAISEEDYDAFEGHPSFQFEITKAAVGTEVEAGYQPAETETKWLTFDRGDDTLGASNPEGYVRRSATLKNLEAGTYTITEVEKTQWNFESVEIVEGNLADANKGTASGQSITVTIGNSFGFGVKNDQLVVNRNSKATVEFENTADYGDTPTHEDVLVNKFVANGDGRYTISQVRLANNGDGQNTAGASESAPAQPATQVGQ